jgi:hypothetical protein
MHAREKKTENKEKKIKITEAIADKEEAQAVYIVSERVVVGRMLRRRERCGILNQGT